MSIGISVVIPCYNAEKYIVRCLESIRSCAYGNLELILINDCSTDQTEEVSRAYLQESGLPAVLLRNEINLGPGSSRNRGIAAVSKEYITFVDADDEVQPDFFRELDRVLTETGYDCVLFDAWMERKGKNFRLPMLVGGRFSCGAVNPKEALVFAKSCTWGKIYRTELIQKNGVQFADMRRAEDGVFHKTALSWCENVFYLPKTLYKYRENVDSLIHHQELLDVNNGFKAYEMIEKNLEGRGFEKELEALYIQGLVYASTLTKIRLGNDLKSCREYYVKAAAKCDLGNPYVPQLSKKYRLCLWLMKINQLWPIKILLRIYNN